MKKLFIFLLLSYSAFSSEIEDKFNFQEKAPFIDYVGCVIANNNIICYGTNSSYVISSDEGHTWKQAKIGNVGTIVKLEYVDNMILGFSLDGHSIKSTDLGNTWQTKQLNFIDSAYDVQFDTGYFFIRGYNSISVIDKSFNLISKFKDTMLTRSYKLFNINLLGKNYTTILGNHIYFDNTTSKLYSLNKTDFINNKITLDSIIICDSCTKGLSGIIEINSKLIFGIFMNNPTDKKNTLLYEYNTITKNIKELTNEEATIYRSKTYYLKNEIYQIYEDYSGNHPYTYFKLNFLKYNKTKDTLESLGTSEIIPTSISSVNDLKLFKDSILIAVMSKKTIMISKDLGKRWETISTCNVTNYGYCSIESDSSKFFYDKFTKLYSNDDNATYKYKTYDSNSADTKKLTDLKVKYVESTGKIVMIYSVLSDPDKNVAVSNDFGKTYEFKNQTLLNYSGADYNYFNKVDDKFIDIINYNPHYREMNKNYFHYSKYTENMDYITNQTDSNNYVHSAVFKNETTGFLISTLNDTLGGRIEILQRNESKRKWERRTTQKINIPLTTIGTYSLTVNEIGTSKDSIVIIYQYQLFTSDTTFTSVFLYDNKFEKFETIYQASEINSKPSIFLDLGNKFVIAGLNFYMESSNRSNVLDWKKYKIKDNSNWSWAKASADGKYYLVNYSSPTIPVSTYKLTLKSNTNIEKTEDQTYFYSYPPYPIPAMNELKSLIYWDMSYNIDDSEIGVYDIYGSKVADREKISINKLNSYSGYLTWDCSGTSTGVYMIQIKHGTNTHNIRAMVVR